MAVKDREITFSAASTAGLNNPGTEIITLIKDGSGNFINPPSYDKMRAYLRGGEVPMLFVTTEGGDTGSLYQLAEYSETENKIQFSNSASAIEFSVGAAAPVVSDVGGGGGGAVTTLHINVTAVNRETMEATFTADKTPTEMLEAAAAGPTWCVVSFAAGIMAPEAVSTGIPPAWYTAGVVAFGGATENAHNDNGNNKMGYAVRSGSTGWIVDLTQFGG